MITGRVSISCKTLRPGVVLPSYQSEGAAGMDLRAFPLDSSISLQIPPMGRLLVQTGIAIQLPEGYEAQVRPRSGLALRYGVTVLNSPGTIDSDYRGEICVLLINLGTDIFWIHTGDRIAQLIVAPVVQACWLEVSTLSETSRGIGSYGHTGLR